MKAISQDLLTEDKVVSSSYIDTMYQVDSETAVRLWKFETNEEQIVQEKKNAKNTLVLGIPAAISFETVKVGDHYGVVYEKLQSKTLGELLMENPDQFDKYVADFTALAHLMHRTHVSPEDFISVKSQFEASFSTKENADLFTPEEIAAARRMVDAVPDADVYLHMDFHPRTLRYVDGELTAHEMISTGWGHPVFDIAATAAQTHLTTVVDPSGRMANALLHMDVATTEKFWKAYIRSYFGCKTEEECAEMERLMAFAGWLRFVTFFPSIVKGYGNRRLGLLQGVCREKFFPFVDQWISDMKDVWPVFEKINQ